MRCNFVAIGLAMLLAQCGSGKKNKTVEDVPPPEIHANSEVCDKNGHCEIDLPLYYDSTDSKETFKYKFRVRHGDGDKPAIVYLVGGPGGTVSDDYEGSGNRISVINTVILFDPRGVGENTVAKPLDPKRFYKTESLAMDTIRVIESLKLKNYILYGSSYGTLLATVTVNRMSQSKLVPLPRAVVLEGILGRHFQLGSEASTDYVKNWHKVRATLSAGTKSHLKKAHPYGSTISREEIGNVIASLLTYEHETLRNLLEKGDTKTIRALFKKHGTDETSQNAIFQTIACQEIINPNADFSFKLTQELELEVVSDPKYCHNFPLVAPFDAKNYTVEPALYYFQGTDDPSTPMWQAEYHRDHIRSTGKKFFNAIPKTAHSVVNLTLDVCKERIWDKVALNESVDGIVATCSASGGMGLVDAKRRDPSETLKTMHKHRGW